MNYEKQVREWYNLASQEKDAIIKFLISYIVVEATLKPKPTGWSKVKQGKSIKCEFFSKVEKRFLINLKCELDDKPLQNMRSNGDKRWSGKFDSETDFNSIVNFIIKTRNNLCYGCKTYAEFRDLYIIKLTNEVLRPLVGVII